MPAKIASLYFLTERLRPTAFRVTRLSLRQATESSEFSPCTAQHRKTQTDFLAPSDIRTHDPNV
jgi:hypothetical protein